MKATRRGWLAGVAGLGALAGTGGYLWRERDSGTGGGPWSLSFPTPDGAQLSMASLRGRPLVLNFWATWCPPCIREMPQLDRFARQYGPSGWQVLGLAVDNLKPVRDFLERQPVSYPIALAGFAGIDLSRQLGNGQGSLPFTALFSATGALRRTHRGEMRFENLAAWAAQES